jgi:hypothetical protein
MVGGIEITSFLHTKVSLYRLGVVRNQFME